jgi:Co/Zn/Cd efflux system component
MTESDCAVPRADTGINRKYRRALWIALAVNATMFAVEIVAGWRAGSVSLLADAVDFFGDAANYGVSLLLYSFAPVWRSRTALLKGASMAAFGVLVLGQAAWAAAEGTVPEASIMGIVGFTALLANVGVTILLFSFREGDADMRAVWLCSRNDAIGNLAVLVAALGVVGTRTGYPDLLVAVIMATLALLSARTVIRHARRELRVPDAPPSSTSS